MPQYFLVITMVELANSIFMVDELTHQSSHKNVRVFKELDFWILVYLVE